MMFITLTDAKYHLRVDHNEDDSVIKDYIDAASSMIDDYCNSNKPLIDVDGKAQPRIKIATILYVSMLYDGEYELSQHQVVPNEIKSLLYGYRILKL